MWLPQVDLPQSQKGKRTQTTTTHQEKVWACHQNQRHGGHPICRWPIRKAAKNIQKTPHRTLRSYLVHPKDKIEDRQKSGVVYSIPCNNCDAKYVGETGRTFGVRLEEHRKEADKTSTRNYTRSARRTSEQEQYKSAITDHVVQKNHVMN